MGKTELLISADALRSLEIVRLFAGAIPTAIGYRSA
jgi:hypothetical protein